MDQIELRQCQTFDYEDIKKCNIGLIKALRNYKQIQDKLLKSGELKKNGESQLWVGSAQQRQYLKMMLTRLINIVDLDIIKIYDYLDQKQESELKNVMNYMLQIIKQFNQTYKYSYQLRSDQQLNSLNTIKITAHQAFPTQYCLNCQKSIQKGRIKKVRQQIGFTEGLRQIDVQERQKLNIKKQVEDDGFIEKHNAYIKAVNEHIYDLIAVMKKDLSGKACQVLAEDVDSDNLKCKNTGNKQGYRSTNMNKQNQEMMKTQRQLIGFEKNNQKFNENFTNKLRISIQNTIIKILKSIQKKQKQKKKNARRQKQIQTYLCSQEQIIVVLQDKIKALKNQVSRYRSAKQQSQGQILKYLQRQGEIKRQLCIMKSQKCILQQKYRKEQQRLYQIESKFKMQMNTKNIEISRLQKIVYELKSKNKKYQEQSASQYQNKKMSTKQLKSRKGTNKVLFQTKEKQSSYKPRPSLDFNLPQEDIIQLNNINSFGVNKKTKNKKVNRLSSHASPKQNQSIILNQKQRENLQAYIKKQFNYNQSSVSSVTQNENKAHQKPHQQKINNFSIFNLINIKIVNSKPQQKTNQYQTYGQEHNRNLNNTNSIKKIKSIRIFKPAKKQYQQNQDKDFYLNNTSLNSVFKHNYHVEQSQYAKRLKNIFESYRSKTQANKDSNQPKNNFKLSNSNYNYNQKTGQKINNDRVQVNQLNQKGEQNKNEQQQELPAVTPNFLSLFGNQKSALQYQNNSGIWPHLIMADRLAVDCQNMSFTSNIQKFFKHLQQKDQQKYRQYIKFLLQPYNLIQLKKKNQQLTLPQLSVGAGKIKEIFTKLIRFHKINHKNCCHVQQFLQKIGYYLF